MIGIDTNVLVRFLTQDEPSQAAAANELFDGFSEESPGYVSIVALLETVWVLRRAYKAEMRAVLEFVLMLVNVDGIVVEQPDLVRRACQLGGEGLDFADAIVALSGREKGCLETVTFDRKAARIPGMRLLA
jgi:predicted nucleic-acid-binding protein